MIDMHRTQTKVQVGLEPTQHVQQYDRIQSATQGHHQTLTRLQEPGQVSGYLPGQEISDFP